MLLNDFVYQVVVDFWEEGDLVGDMVYLFDWGYYGDFQCGDWEKVVKWCLLFDEIIEKSDSVLCVVFMEGLFWGCQVVEIEQWEMWEIGEKMGCLVVYVIGFVVFEQGDVVLVKKVVVCFEEFGEEKVDECLMFSCGFGFVKVVYCFLNVCVLFVEGKLKQVIVFFDEGVEIVELMGLLCGLVMLVKLIYEFYGEVFFEFDCFEDVVECFCVLLFCMLNCFWFLLGFVWVLQVVGDMEGVMDVYCCVVEVWEGWIQIDGYNEVVVVLG